MIAPGTVFAACSGDKLHLRLNCGLPWSGQIAGAIATLGQLAHELFLPSRRRAGESSASR